MDGVHQLELPESADETAVQEFLHILDEHRKTCEKQGKYVEAELAQRRLEDLRKHEEARRREAMKSRQIAERLGVEEAHMLEFQQFTALWDRKISDFEKHAKELEDAMKERHSLEMKQFHEQTDFSQVRPKFSRDLLNLRRIQETLARQKEYAEAHKVKVKADNLEAWEREKLRMEHAQGSQTRETKMRQHHTAELAALKKRIQTTREELKKQRQTELERLLQRFQNVKAELEAQQHMERQRALKYAFAPPPSASVTASLSLSASAGGSPGKTRSSARGRGGRK